MGKRSYIPIGETNANERYVVGTRIEESTSILNFRHKGKLRSEIPQKEYYAFMEKKMVSGYYVMNP